MEPIELAAGSLTAIFRPAETFLRRIKLGGREILRGIYLALRDPNWNTVPPIVEDVETRQDEAGFAREFAVSWRQGDIDFRGRCRLSGSADGRLEYRFDGKSHSAFQSNRIGFLVLHSADLAGTACRVRRVDGSEVVGSFPVDISPRQPFFDIRAITHPIGEGLELETAMEGETFEMEDQRNWTDASYKTYCRPLAKPFPFEVRPGDAISQRIALTVLGGPIPPPRQRPRRERRPVELALPERPSWRPTPKRGALFCPDDDGAYEPEEVERLARLNLDYLRVDIDLDNLWEERLKRADALAQGMGAALQIALVSNRRPDDLAAFLEAAGERSAPVGSWLVFGKGEKTASPETLGSFRETFGKSGLPGRVYSGADAFFTEYNRERPAFDLLDGVCFSINPQVHAFDNDSLMETLEMQGLVVEQARAIAGGKPVAVSAITARMRFNPNATGPEPEPEPGELPSAVDPRQAGPVFAAWTAGSLHYMAISEAAEAAYYETRGWKGLMERPEGSPLPDKFPSRPGQPFPLYHVLKLFGEARGGRHAPLETDDKLAAIGGWLERPGGPVLYAANLRETDTPVRLSAPDLPSRLARLNEGNAREPGPLEDAEETLERTAEGHAELRLAPYEVVCLRR